MIDFKRIVTKILEKTKTKHPEAHAEIVNIIVDEVMQNEPTPNIISPRIGGIGDLIYKNPCDGCTYQNTPGDHCDLCSKNPYKKTLTGNIKIK